MERELIDLLVRDARPVRPLATPAVRLARWVGAAALCLTAGVGWLRVRHDLADVWTTPGFLLQAALLLSAAVLSAGGAFVLSVPGAERRGLTRGLPLLAAAMWGLWLAAGWGLAPAGAAAEWPRPAPMCAVEVIALGLAPGVLLFVLVRQAAPLRLTWTGVLAALATGALGALGSQFVCADDSPAHLLLWHFLPMAVLATAGIVLGRVILRWDAKRHDPPEAGAGGHGG